MGSPLRVVVTSDNHLGRYYDRLGARQLETRRAWLRQGWEMAVACALERGAHLFLQGGDLFDTPDPRNVERVAVALRFSRAGKSLSVRRSGTLGRDLPRARRQR